MTRILCIEDEAALRRVIVAELQDAGYEVAEAGSGAEGLRAILSDPPDLVLCDVNMPGMTGHELLSVLRAEHPEHAATPFVFLSALADRKDMIAGIRLGADDYLTKPVDFDQLLLTVTARLGQMQRIGRRIDHERANAAESLRLSRYGDAATGLATALFWAVRLGEALAAGGAPALLMLDMDRFKGVGVLIGRAGADAVLREVAERLSRAAGPDAILGRVGDDKFCVVAADSGAAPALAEELRRACSEPFQVGERRVFVTAKVGYAVAPEDGADADALLAGAEAAVLDAKRAGGNAVRRFARESATRDVELAHIENALRGALDAGELELHFQPKVSLATGQPVGMEALLRWDSPSLGPVSPSRFILVAERSDLILEIGAFVLREACRHMRGWLDRGLDPAMRVAVNLSARQVRHPDLLGTVRAVLAETGLPPANLVLEITESGLIDDDGGKDAAATLSDLRDLGLTLSVDDFGTGFSALGYLARLPVQELKIDQSFVRGLPHTAGNRTIVLAVIAMAQGLGLKLVAEGVETPEQAAFLREHGCDVAQGFLMARPLPPEGLARFLGLAAAG